MRYPLPLPAPLNKSSFTLQDGLERGLSPARLRGANVKIVGRGLRISTEATADFTNKVRPYTRVTSESAASHTTAARLWSFPLPQHQEEDESIHVSRPSSTSTPRRKGVVGHLSKLYSDEVVCRDGIYLTTRLRTWLDLAESLLVDDLVVIADYLIRHPRPELEGRSAPYATKEQLQQLLDRHRGKQGIRAAREALQLSRVGADSPPETKLRLAILRAGLPEPSVNLPLMDGNGAAYHEPDLSYPEYRTAIEYEGSHHSHPDQIVRDIDREDRVLAAGWKQVRISRHHLGQDARPAINKIRAVLVAQGWRPNRPR